MSAGHETELNPNSGAFFESSPQAYENEVDFWVDRFGYHKANDATLPLHRALRQDFTHLAEMVIRQVPPGREREMALTSLQQSLMWANAGVAIKLAPLALDQ